MNQLHSDRPPENESEATIFKYEKQHTYIDKYNHVIRCLSKFLFKLYPDVNNFTLVYRAWLLNSCALSQRRINHQRTEWDQCVSKVASELKLLHIAAPKHMWAESNSWHVFCMVIMWSTFPQLACSEAGEPGNSWWRRIRSGPGEWSRLGLAASGLGENNSAAAHTSRLTHREKNPHQPGGKWNFTFFYKPPCKDCQGVMVMWNLLQETSYRW